MRSVTHIRNTLGECPVWSPEEQTLYWMDIPEKALYAYLPASSAVRHWNLPEFPGGLALRAKGGLVVGLQGSIAAFDPESGALEQLVSFEKMDGGMRFNDAKCDSLGRFFIGTMKDPDITDNPNAEDERHGAGSLYVLEPTHALTVIDTGFTIPNGFAWNSDDTTLYVSDSEEKTIFAYDYTLADARLGERRVFVDLTREPGVPDGACVDSEGCLWSARHGDGRIVRYDPQGKTMSSIRLPMTKPTSLAFGGSNLDTLYVTSATQGLSQEELSRQPLAGTVLALDVGVKGISEPAFAG